MFVVLKPKLQILQCKYLEIKELQWRLLEKWFMTNFLNILAQGHYLPKNCGTPKQIIIGIHVLV